MADRLSALLQRFELRARIFHGGCLQGTDVLHPGQGESHLHVVRQGALTVTDRDGRHTRIDGPSVLFYPRPVPHRLEAIDTTGAQIVCAEIEFGVGDENPLMRALPSPLFVPLGHLPALEPTLALLFGEAFGRRCGHDAVSNRLTEVLVVQVLRYGIEQRLVDGGLMAGLSDARLHKALSAVHAQPGRAWTLDSMAAEAGMSRARFAARFSQLVGLPPGEYLIGWRLGLARTMLRRGMPVKQVALEVGYAHASALARVFAQRLGVSPTAWQARAAP